MGVARIVLRTHTRMLAEKPPLPPILGRTKTEVKKVAVQVSHKIASLSLDLWPF